MENKTNAAMLGMLTAAVASWDSMTGTSQRRLLHSAMTPMMRSSAIAAYHAQKRRFIARRRRRWMRSLDSRW